MIKVIVAGAAGRMGKLLVKNILEADDMSLIGATEIEKSPYIGKDAGITAGTANSNVSITPKLSPLLSGADILIDFSTGNVVESAELAINTGLGVVIGTTALSSEEKQKLKKLALSGGKIVFAPNMSIGVNLLFSLVEKVAKTLNENYEIEIVEMHHNQKKDAPSGTAAKLVEIAAEARKLNFDKNICYGRNGITGARPKQEIGVHALRGGDVVGEHTVIFATNGERVELTHKASSRETFALGALEAARFLQKVGPGLYTMQDVLGL
jgi:4-hydroxy-tetrahydrodipicolinate reductase